MEKKITLEYFEEHFEEIVDLCNKEKTTYIILKDGLPYVVLMPA